MRGLFVLVALGDYSCGFVRYNCNSFATPKGCVFEPYQSEKGINFAYYGMKFGMVFKGNTKVFFFSAVND